MTLNDLDGLFGVKFCFRAGLAGSDGATSENNCVKTNKDRHIVSAVHIFGRESSFLMSNLSPHSHDMTVKFKVKYKRIGFRH